MADLIKDDLIDAKKLCSNCAFYRLKHDEEPCRTCKWYEKWAPAHPTGDADMYKKQAEELIDAWWKHECEFIDKLRVEYGTKLIKDDAVMIGPITRPKQPEPEPKKVYLTTHNPYMSKDWKERFEEIMEARTKTDPWSVTVDTDVASMYPKLEPLVKEELANYSPSKQLYEVGMQAAKGFNTTVLKMHKDAIDAARYSFDKYCDYAMEKSWEDYCYMIPPRAGKSAALGAIKLGERELEYCKQDVEETMKLYEAFKTKEDDTYDWMAHSVNDIFKDMGTILYRRQEAEKDFKSKEWVWEISEDIWQRLKEKPEFISNCYSTSLPATIYCIDVRVTKFVQNYIKLVRKVKKEESMNIIIYRSTSQRAREVSRYFEERFKEHPYGQNVAMTSGGLRFSGITNALRIWICYGGCEKMTGIHPDYFSSDSAEATEYLRQRISSHGDTHSHGLYKLWTIISKYLNEQYEKKENVMNMDLIMNNDVVIRYPDGTEYKARVDVVNCQSNTATCMELHLLDEKPIGKAYNAKPFVTMPRHSGYSEAMRWSQFAKEMLYGVDLSHSIPQIDQVIFNAPATIVYWKDGTKTVVQARGEMFDPEKGLAMAISKKAMGNTRDYYIPFKKWLKKFKKKVEKGRPNDCEGTCATCCPVRTNDQLFATSGCKNCDQYMNHFEN